MFFADQQASHQQVQLVFADQHTESQQRKVALAGLLTGLFGHAPTALLHEPGQTALLTGLSGTPATGTSPEEVPVLVVIIGIA